MPVLRFSPCAVRVSLWLCPAQQPRAGRVVGSLGSGFEPGDGWKRFLVSPAEIRLIRTYYSCISVKCSGFRSII